MNDRVLVVFEAVAENLVGAQNQFSHLRIEAGGREGLLSHAALHVATLLELDQLLRVPQDHYASLRHGD